MCFISIEKEQNSYKCYTFTSSALLHLFFTSNSVGFVSGRARLFSYHRAQGTLATPLDGLIHPKKKDKDKCFYGAL